MSTLNCVWHIIFRASRIFSNSTSEKCKYHVKCGTNNFVYLPFLLLFSIFRLPVGFQTAVFVNFPPVVKNITFNIPISDLQNNFLFPLITVQKPNVRFLITFGKENAFLRIDKLVFLLTGYNGQTCFTGV